MVLRFQILVYGNWGSLRILWGSVLDIRLSVFEVEGCLTEAAVDGDNDTTRAWTERYCQSNKLLT